MSWGINLNATEKEKIFAEFNDSLKGMNCTDGLAYRYYSRIYDLGRELADREYEQGIEEFIEWLYERRSISFHEKQNMKDWFLYGGKYDR